MKKRRDKEYFTLSPDIREEFLKHIEDNNLNKSKLIETLIEEYMEKVKEIKN
jgi:hypothetical protein